MALSFGKKEKKAKAAPAAAVRVAQPKPVVPPDIYTLLLGLSALFLIAATITLWLNYYWYQATDPAVAPLTWVR